jgi:hypothetical protein
MDFERRLLKLERENLLLKLVLGASVVLILLTVVMGASFGQNVDESLKVKKIQVVDAQGKEVAVIDAAGIRYSNEGSQIMADTIVGRSSVTAVRDPKNMDRYVQISVDGAKGTCSFLIGNRRAVKHTIMNDNGNLITGID